MRQSHIAHSLNNWLFANIGFYTTHKAYLKLGVGSKEENEEESEVLIGHFRETQRVRSQCD